MRGGNRLGLRVPCAGVGAWSVGALPGSRTRIARLGGGSPVHWARRAVGGIGCFAKVAKQW